MHGRRSSTFLSILRARILSAWLPAAVFVLLIALWESAARLALVDPMVLPAPSDIAANFVDGFRSGIYTKNLQITLVQAFSGFALACVLGIGIGSIASFSERFSRALQPILIAVEATPKIALAPLIIVWFGYGIGSKIVLAAAIAFFPVFIGTAAGLRAAEPGRLDVLRALGASRFAAVPDGRAALGACRTSSPASTSLSCWRCWARSWASSWAPRKGSAP